MNLNISKYSIDIFNKISILIITYSEYNAFVGSLIDYYKKECFKLSNLTIEQSDLIHKWTIILINIFIKDEEVQPIAERIYKNMKNLNCDMKIMYDLFCQLIAAIFTCNYQIFIMKLNLYLQIE